MLKKMLKSYDYTLILAIVLLCIFGLIMVYSSSMVIAVTRYQLSSDYFFEKQKTSLVIASFVFLFTMLFPYRRLQNSRLLMLVMLGSVSLLLAVFFFGFVAGGAQSWIKLGARSIQPSEYMKLAVIIYLSAMYAKKQKVINDMKHGVMPPILFVVFVLICIVIQPDLGTAFIIFLISASIITSSGMNLKTIGKLTILGSIGAIIFALIMLAFGVFSGYQLDRFTGFMKPFETIDGAGYQLVNSYIAIAGGGVTGVGLGQSVQKYGYLPEAHTDFIMSIVAEELGLFGVAFVLFLIAFIIFKALHLARKCEDPFGSLLAIGIASMFGIQSFINLGGVTGLIPITGVTLPFISYGGSSLLVLMASAGLLVNVSMQHNYRQKFKHAQTDDSQKIKMDNFSRSF
ncbi:putative lipid II flippase FtsW [Bacillus sp. HMF5848]|uniref:putative lipid II flippase FtsW n=1 Tax=Bacillus sp. HMF5848 TaxID=2495421 RepID=UPI000F78DA77|nr:putative lipid II flippase FtsW [Bacillus sp. HMF5848]RSK26894.1 putative lipid II flippase FtsW [Bacillus sp. HMF5848]